MNERTPQTQPTEAIPPPEEKDFLRVAALLRHFGLVVVTLKSGDFWVGRPAALKFIEIKPSLLSVHHSLKEAIYNAIAAIEKEAK